MHRTSRAHDAGAVGGPDALVAEANTQDRRAGSEAPHDLGGDSRLARRARAWGDDDVGRPEGADLLVRRGVMTSYDGLLPQLGHVPRQVVDERVVVVDQQDHGTRAAMSPRALSSVSRYSSSGSESATIPPPT